MSLHAASHQVLFWPVILVRRRACVPVLVDGFRMQCKQSTRKQTVPLVYVCIGTFCYMVHCLLQFNPLTGGAGLHIGMTILCCTVLCCAMRVVFLQALSDHILACRRDSSSHRSS